MENRIKKAMGDLFNFDVNSINNESSSDNIENWDSLKHMNLIIALEDEFNIISDNIEDLLNYQLICLAVGEAINLDKPF
jgi:acyl carrier protein